MAGALDRNALIGRRENGGRSEPGGGWERIPLLDQPSVLFIATRGSRSRTRTPHTVSRERGGARRPSDTSEPLHASESCRTFAARFRFETGPTVSPARDWRAVLTSDLNRLD